MCSDEVSELLAGFTMEIVFSWQNLCSQDRESPCFRGDMAKTLQGAKSFLISKERDKQACDICSELLEDPNAGEKLRLHIGRVIRP